jgi:hypothetical protein
MTTIDKLNALPNPFMGIHLPRKPSKPAKPIKRPTRR